MKKLSAFFAVFFLAATAITLPIAKALDQVHGSPTHPVFLLGVLTMLGAIYGLTVSLVTPNEVR